ncbi:hypothetical protein L596_019656 [Steinernema carpocapsae]|uniref:MADF domain-containing protein n=1 Tax=Steinernema carpocapsae TaxID=34508 RepID=A0A4U5MR63_STECR|nr:hypothetical protein L596_019656 [Steinernema carpocapsae]
MNCQRKKLKYEEEDDVEVITLESSSDEAEDEAEEEDVVEEDLEAGRHRKRKKKKVAYIKQFCEDYGDEAFDLLIAEVGNYPEFYSITFYNSTQKSIQDLKPEVQIAWRKIMRSMKEFCPELIENDAFDTWRRLRKSYRQVQCPKEVRGKIAYLTEYEINKDNNRTIPLTQHGDEAVILLIEEMKKYPDLYKMPSKKFLRREDMLEEETAAWDNVVRAIQDRFPNVVEKSIAAYWHRLRRSYGTKDANVVAKFEERLKFLDFKCLKLVGDKTENPERFATKDEQIVPMGEYGEKAFNLLIKEISKRPELYEIGISAMSKPEMLKEDGRKAWKQVMRALKKRFPKVSELSAWKFWWKCRVRYGTQREHEVKNYKDKLGFLDFKLKWKDSKHVDSPEPTTSVSVKEENPITPSTSYYARKSNATLIKKDTLTPSTSALSYVMPLASYGDDAVNLLIDEIQKYPEFYKPGVHRIYTSEEMKSDEAKAAWRKIVKVVKRQYPEVSDQTAFSCWRKLRLRYGTKDGQSLTRFGDKLQFLDFKFGTRGEKEQLEIPSETLCTVKVEGVSDVKETMEVDPSSSHERSPFPDEDKPVLLLIQEIQKHPELYKSGLCDVFKPNQLKTEEMRIAWTKVMDVISVHFPEVNDETIFRQWRTLRQKYGTKEKRSTHRFNPLLRFLDFKKRKSGRTDSPPDVTVQNAKSSKDYSPGAPGPSFSLLRPEPTLEIDPPSDDEISVSSISSVTTDSSDAEAMEELRIKEADRLDRLSYFHQFLALHGKRTTTFLVDEIGKHLDFYKLRLTRATVPEKLSAKAKEIWDKIAEVLQEKHPRVNEVDAYRAWRYLRKYYFEQDREKIWDVPYLNACIVPKSKPKSTRFLYHTTYEDINPESSLASIEPSSTCSEMSESSTYVENTMSYNDLLANLTERNAMLNNDESTALDSVMEPSIGYACGTGELEGVVKMEEEDVIVLD